MKVALLICGQARFFRQGYNTIKIILDQYKPDVFIHTWKSSSKFESAQNLSINITESDLAEYIALYNPKKYEIEDQLTHEYIDSVLERKVYERTSGPLTKYNFFSYLYSLEKTFKLVDCPKDYELYIVVRSDAHIKKFPDLEKIDTSKIAVYNRLASRAEVLDTMVTIIPEKYINTYSSFINYLDEYYAKGYYFNYEELILAHIRESGLLDSLLRLNADEFCFGLWRSEDKIEHF